MSKTKYEIGIEEVNNIIKKNAKYLAYDIDHSFATIMLPILKQYKKDAFKFIDFSYNECNWWERLIYNKCYKLKRLFNFIKNRASKRFEIHLDNVIKALEDILNINSKEYYKKWNIKELKEIKYDYIPSKLNNEIVYELKVKEKYVNNDKYNKSIISYNLKQERKAYKWRQKQLKWLINNLNKLWW